LKKSLGVRGCGLLIHSSQSLSEMKFMVTAVFHESIEILGIMPHGVLPQAGDLGTTV